MKCTNCPWEGEEAKGPLNHCPVCGDNTDATDGPVKVEPKEDKNPLDLNGDGKVDGKDKSIAGRVLASGRKKKSKKRK